MKPLKQETAQFRKEYILKELRKNYGNVNRTAKVLGINRNTLILEIGNLKIEREVKQIRKKYGHVVSGKFRLRNVALAKTNRLRKAAYDFQKKYITKALQETGGNEVQTAKMLGIHRNTLMNKIEYLDMKKDLQVIRRKNGWWIKK